MCSSDLVVLLILIPCLLNLVNPTRPSLHCSGSEVVEPDFSHKHRRDTVSTSLLLSVTFLGPALQFLLVEYFGRGTAAAAKEPAIWSQSRTRARQTWALARAAAAVYVHYFVGFVFTVAVMEIGKTTLNYPRPHFVDTCKPTFPPSACVLGWVDVYQCASAQPQIVNGSVAVTAVSRWRLVDAHKSFPSGHAAIGTYTALFMIGYQHQHRAMGRLWLRLGHFVALYVVHAAWLTWGLFCGYSRIMDYRHHGIDVVAGNLVGVAGALFAAYVMRREAAAVATAGAQLGEAGGGSGGGGASSNGDLKRSSGGGLHRKLSAQTSTMTQMSDISEDDELYQV